MATPLKLLILEDNALDAELEVRQLQAAGYDCGWLRVQTREEFEACLERSKRWAAQQLLRDAHGRLRTLSARLLQVEETERGRIARELHDGVGQLLTAVKLRLAGLNPSSADYASLRNECVGAIDEALEQVRRMSCDLRPSRLDDLGLASALRSHLDRQAGSAGFRPHFTQDVVDMVFSVGATQRS